MVMVFGATVKKNINRILLAQTLENIKFMGWYILEVEGTDI
jgi:hypothetical protein